MRAKKVVAVICGGAFLYFRRGDFIGVGGGVSGNDILGFKDSSWESESMEDVEVGDDCGAEFREPLSAVASAGNFESVIRKTVSMFSFFSFFDATRLSRTVWWGSLVMRMGM